MEAINFNQPLNFDTSNVIDMSCMFIGASKFNQPLYFDTSNVTDMGWMFRCATKYIHPLYFDTSNVIDMSCMFNDIKHQPLKLNYNKLLLFYILNNINNELPILIDSVINN
jgi:hypothetical protein